MGRFWALFFILAAVIIFVVSWISPAMGWWFPGDGVENGTRLFDTGSQDR